MKPLSAESRALLREARERERHGYAVKTPKRMTVGEQERDMGSPAAEAREQAMKLFGSDTMFLAPSVDAQMTNPGSSLTGRSIMEEVVEAELDGTLAPFVPGPIGAYVRKPKKKPLTDRQVQQIHNKWREQERAIMLALRAKNDATMVSELESL